MKEKLKKVFTNIRVIIVLLFLIGMIVAIHPVPNNKGVVIRNVMQNSSASLAGFESPKSSVRPMAREKITAIDNRPIENIEDYYNYINSLGINRTITIRTDKNIYRATTKAKTETIELNETELKTITEEVFDKELNKTVNKTKTIEVKKTETKILGTEDIGLKVMNAPTTNLKKGLDLQGGTRVLLQPEKKISDEQMSDLLANMEQRLNVYGLSDVVLKPVNDLSGNKFILVEIAGVNEEEVKELLSKQGKFEAKIANNTVFIGGKDIKYVCKSAECSGIDPYQGCGTIQDGGWACRFRFSIALSPESAERQAELTKNLDVITEGDEDYLSEKIILFLDDKQVDELNIGSELKGRAVTDIQISGSGTGATEQEAMFNSLTNMKRLQTILITGSLPIKLNTVKVDSISPSLGEEFIKSAWIMALISIIVVEIIIYLRYRNIKVAVPMIIVSVIEIIMLLGFASLIGWNLDLAAIAGIIMAIGTGVNDQIIIADETLRGEISQIYDWKKRIKNAFVIIIGAYLTVFVAMVPLLFAGAGMLKGFAITTIIGISIGVIITRPAFGQVIEILLKE